MNYIRLQKVYICCLQSVHLNAFRGQLLLMVTFEARSEGEGKTIDEIHQGLAIALFQTPSLSSNSLDKINEVKVQNLAYFAIDHFSLDVTFSWYLAGTYIAPPNASKQNLRSIFDRIRKSNSREKPIKKQNTENPPQVTVSDYVNFYQNEIDIEDVWYRKTNDFLEDFYLQYSPERYRDIYLANLEVRKSFDQTLNHLNVISKESSSHQLGLSEFGGPSSEIGYQFSTINNKIDDLIDELSKVDEMSESIETYSKLKNLITYVEKRITETPISELRRPHYNGIEDLRKFHFTHAWRHPAAIISIKTAKGPNRAQLKAEQYEKLTEISGSFDMYLKRMASKLKAKDLISGSDHSRL